MSQSPVERKLQPLEKYVDRRGKEKETDWNRSVATVTHPELIIVIVFCAIGLLVTANVGLRIPDFSAMIAQFAQFP
jgi:hypothetical protein